MEFLLLCNNHIKNTNKEIYSSILLLVGARSGIRAGATQRRVSGDR